MAVQQTPGKYLEVQVGEDGKIIYFAKNGTNFFAVANDENLDSFQDFQARDDDVWICGYLKAGTHWIWEVVTMLLHNISELSPRSKENNMAEIVGSNTFEELPSPRILNSHFPVHLMPADVWKKDNKIIYVIRNAKDSLVSCYFHYKDGGALGSKGKNVTLHEFYKAGVCDSSGLFDGWPGYNTEWQKKHRNNCNILYVKYEDIHKDHLGTIRTIANFLKSPRSEDVYRNIQMKTSFEYMKKNKVALDPEGHPTLKLVGNTCDPDIIYRKGKIGDWKNHFTVALNEEFDKEYEEHGSIHEQ